MSRALRPIGYEDRLSLVEHLDELRSRLIVCAVALGAAFALALWQNHPLLDAVNRPLQHVKPPSGAAGRLEASARSDALVRRALERGGVAFERLARSSSSASAADRRAIREALRSYREAVSALPRATAHRQPITLGVGEPFGTTVLVSLYFALLLGMPVILYQLYAFVLPAFSPGERRVALPLMMMVPFLFAAGVAFGYFVVLPPAIQFLQNFNSGSFDALVQAKPYYSFVALTLVSMGLVFQLPVLILALNRLRLVSIHQLRRNRRYAIVIIAVVAMLLPGTDPVITVVEMVPLLILYELSILLAAWLDRPGRRASDSALLPTEADGS